MSVAFPITVPVDLPPGVRIGVVAARWNAVITDALLSDCVARLKERGVAADHIAVHHVPGAFELPVAAKWLTATCDAVVCLGCVVRGDTPHFDYVAGETARGVMRVSIETSVPVIFGVLTVNTQQQAQDRTGGPHGHGGVGAADAAVEMVALARQLR